MAPTTIAVLHGDQTGEELLLEALRLLEPDVLGLNIEKRDFDLSLEERRKTRNEVVVSGDTVWARQKGGGTNLGSFAGHAPTGIKAFIDVIDVVRIEDGKIVEHWGVPDQLGMMMQLGLIPQPVRA